MKKILLAVFLTALFAGSACAAEGVIAWAAGGGTDTLMRPLINHIGNITPMIKTGLAGAIASSYVYEKTSDGETLLMNAENPTLYKFLGYGNIDYDDFECVLLIATEVVGVIVPSNSKYNSFKEIVEDVKAGREVVEATTNVGGMPWTLTAMLGKITGVNFVQQWYAGDKDAMEAVMNGKADFTFCKLQMGRELFEQGRLKYISLISKEKLEGWDVQLITDEYPEFAEYLPWGPFYGVFVKKDAPAEKIAEWKKLFAEAYATEAYQKLLSDSRMTKLGLNGAAALDYIHGWQSRTLSVLSKADLNMKFRFHSPE